MRLKTKLVLAITGLVFLVVTVLSWLYLEQLLAQRISQSYSANDMVAHQILYGTRLALANGLRGRTLDANDPVALRAAVAESLQKDEGLEALLNSVIRYSPTAPCSAPIQRRTIRLCPSVRITKSFSTPGC